MSNSIENRRYRVDLSNVGLRAQATAAGLVQLCVELQRANVLPQQAIDRIKAAIADEILASVPRHVSTHQYKDETRSRLDRIFAGKQEVGPADQLGMKLWEQSVSE